MQIQNQFEVAADPDRVYAFLLDVNKVVACMPGAELSEVIDPDRFKGKIKIKVGPVTVSYSGTARIAQRDAAQRLAVLEADGRETTGSGSARATATMTVTASGEGSLVNLATDFTVAGRVANFGRGMMEDVSRRLVGQMATAIKQQLEYAPEQSPDTASGDPGAWSSPGSAPTRGAAPSPAQPEVKPVNALGLLFSVLGDRVKHAFRR
ncbi:MAG TPA: SRPBCC family protein [Candidatus Acidoferrales bacterium]|nr:SRPBCC family protein [Candidatus Acidoferrales bacterium]